LTKAAGTTLPPPAELPRPKLVWEAADIESGMSTPPCSGGFVFVHSIEKDMLSARDLQSGQVRWSVPAPKGRINSLVVIGERLLANTAEGDVSAYSTRDGVHQWDLHTKCMFMFGIRGKNDVAAGMCMPVPGSGEPRVPLIRRESSLVGFDLAHGREAWRISIPGMRAFGSATDGEQVYVAMMEMPDATKGPAGGMSSTVTAYDVRSGKQRWKVSAPDLVMSAFTSGGFLVLRGRNTSALSTSDGKLAWSNAPPASNAMLSFDPTPDLMGGDPPVTEGRLLRANGSSVEAVDIASGKVAQTWALPQPGAEKDAAPLMARMVRVQASEGRIAVWIPERDPMAPGYLVTWRGSDSKTLQASGGLIETPRLVGDRLVVVGDRARAVSGGRGATLRVYSLSETDAPEAKALDATERVRRHLTRRVMRDKRSIEELKAIPGATAALIKLAGDATFEERGAAIEMLAKLKDPSAVAPLLAILDEKVPDEPPQPADAPKMPVGGKMTPEDLHRIREYRPPKEYLAAEERHQSAEAAHLAAIGALAEFDRADIAKRLAPLLLAGPKSDVTAMRMATDRGAIYRLLARVAGPAELEALKTFDARTAGTGGWSHLCAKADRVPDSASSPGAVIHGIGMHGFLSAFPCGAPVAGGSFRMGQDESGVWIRQRRGNAWGVPALALKFEGGGLAERPPTVESAELVAGKLRLRGWNGGGPSASPWSGEVDVALALADRDHDGIPDETERLLGTNPDRADTDGDGIRDGDDPSPLARPAQTDTAKVATEIVRYAINFQRDFEASHIIIVAGVPESFGEVRSAETVLLHRESGDREARAPSAMYLRISKIEISGDDAKAQLDVNYGGRGNGQQMKVRRVGGIWRVVESGESSSWVE
jgi:outer membrane protein assembly factor BamB